MATPSLLESIEEQLKQRKAAWDARKHAKKQSNIVSRAKSPFIDHWTMKLSEGYGHPDGSPISDSSAQVSQSTDNQCVDNSSLFSKQESASQSTVDDTNNTLDKNAAGYHAESETSDQHLQISQESNDHTKDSSSQGSEEHNEMSKNRTSLAPPAIHPQSDGYDKASFSEKSSNTSRSKKRSFDNVVESSSSEGTDNVGDLGKQHTKRHKAKHPEPGSKVQKARPSKPRTTRRCGDSKTHKQLADEDSGDNVPRGRRDKILEESLDRIEKDSEALSRTDKPIDETTDTPSDGREFDNADDSPKVIEKASAAPSKEDLRIKTELRLKNNAQFYDDLKAKCADRIIGLHTRRLFIKHHKDPSLSSLINLKRKRVIEQESKATLPISKMRKIFHEERAPLTNINHLPGLQPVQQAETQSYQAVGNDGVNLPPHPTSASIQGQPNLKPDLTSLEGVLAALRSHTTPPAAETSAAPTASKEPSQQQQSSAQNHPTSAMTEEESAALEEDANEVFNEFGIIDDDDGEPREREVTPPYQPSGEGPDSDEAGQIGEEDDDMPDDEGSDTSDEEDSDMPDDDGSDTSDEDDDDMPDDDGSDTSGENHGDMPGDDGHDTSDDVDSVMPDEESEEEDCAGNESEAQGGHSNAAIEAQQEAPEVYYLRKANKE